MQSCMKDRHAESIHVESKDDGAEACCSGLGDCWAAGACTTVRLAVLRENVFVE